MPWLSDWRCLPHAFMWSPEIPARYFLMATRSKLSEQIPSLKNWGGVRSIERRLHEVNQELLEALEEATRCLAWHEAKHGVGMDRAAVDKARAAIAKATGGEAVGLNK